MTLPRVYAVLDEDAASAAGWTLEALARACVGGGARLLQVRAKRLAGRALLGVCERVVAVAAEAGARVIVNDRPDIARLAGAWGVHVGQDDLSPRAVRTVAGDQVVVGLSTHTPAQVTASAGEPIDYVAIGPVFGTATKDTGYQPVGLEMVARAAAESGRPVVAIGGITLDRAARVIASGASSVAIVSDLFTGGDPAARTRAFVDRLQR